MTNFRHKWEGNCGFWLVFRLNDARLRRFCTSSGEHGQSCQQAYFAPGSSNFVKYSSATAINSRAHASAFRAWPDVTPGPTPSSNLMPRRGQPEYVDCMLRAAKSQSVIGQPAFHSVQSF